MWETHHTHSHTYFVHNMEDYFNLLIKSNSYWQIPEEAAIADINAAAAAITAIAAGTTIISTAFHQRNS